MKRLFRDGKTVPRWVILLLDLILIFCAFSFSYFVVSRFKIEEMLREDYLIYAGIFCLVALPVLYKMRLHTGLLRYSNTTDVFRVFKAILYTEAIYYILMLVLINTVFFFRPAFLTGLLLINFFIASSLMIIMRIMAKGTFSMLVKRVNEKETIRILIYGSDKNAIVVKRALESSDDTNYKVEAFIDSDRAHLNSYIEQKRVYHIKELRKLKEQKGIDQLVIVNEDLGEGDKRVLLERCLRLGLKVLTVPPVHSWLTNGLSQNQIQNLRIEDLLQRAPIQIDQHSVCDDLKNKRVLVTGAAGSIGSEIVRQVLQYKPTLVVLCDQAESPLHIMQLELEEHFPMATFEIVIADIRNKARMTKLFRVFRPHIVYHAAAYKHVPLMENNPFEAISTNVLGTRNLVDLAILFDAAKFVMVSTDKAVNPTNIMGASKRIAEIYAQSLNNHQFEFRKAHNLTSGGKTRFITTRFGNVLGSNGSVIPRFRAQIEKGGPITVTHPEITRYFMTIAEAVQLVLEAGNMGKGGEIFVFDMGEPVRIFDMAKKMVQLAGLELGKDIDIIFTGLRPGEKLYEELLAEEETTLPTYHEKISIAKVRNYTYAEVKEAIDRLCVVNNAQENEAIVRSMKQLVPEFISKNSPYESLDKTLNRTAS